MAKNSLLNNFVWKFAEQVSAQVISTVVSIILARLLAPSYYGVVAMVMVFITVANVFVGEGLGSALIQKKNATPLDFFSILYFNIGFSVVLYLILFFAAPYISAFYGDDYAILTPVLRVLGVIVIISAVNSVLHAYVSKKMIFRKFFVATLGGTILSAIVGITMAYNGFGVWALVAQRIVSVFVSTLTLGISLGKKPRLIFSFKSVKELIPYGTRILGSGLLITGYKELRALIIGKFYSSADLAFFNKGKQFPTLITTNISSSLSAVLFPKMSGEQDNKEKVKTTMRNSIRITSYVMSPMMLGLAAVAPAFVRLILTDKWLPAVPLLQMFCISELFFPINSANMQAIKALGKGKIYLRIEIIKKITELVILLAVMKISVTAIVVQLVVCSALFTVINAYPNIKLLNYGIKEQMKDILPSFTMSGIMAVAVYSLGQLSIGDFPLLCLQAVSGFMVYIILSSVTNNREFKFILNLVFGKFKKRVKGVAKK